MQQWMIDRHICRNTVNDRTRRIKRLFRWAVAEELIDSTVCETLRATFPIGFGRDDVKETAVVKPVDEATVSATLPWLTPVVGAMVQIQRLTGGRPGEVCSMRRCEIDTSGEIWIYRPPNHKTACRGQPRAILIGPRAQEILRPFLLRPHDAYVFTPAESERKRLASLHEARKTPVSCGNRPGSNRVKSPKRRRRIRYDSNSYRHAITGAISHARIQALSCHGRFEGK